MKLHDMTEAQRAAEWKRLGMFRYAVQWRREIHERHLTEDEHGTTGELALPVTEARVVVKRGAR